MRRRRLQELLVLLLRVLVVVFLVLVFAQPIIPAKQVVGLGDEVGVLLDTSLSMQAVGAGQQSLLQEAITKAAALGKSYGTAARFRLLGHSRSALTQAAYMGELTELRTSDKQPNWSNLSAWQKDESRGPVYLFSDFQRNGQLAKLLPSLSKSNQIVLVPQVARAVANVYVDSVWLDDAFVRTQVNLGLHIRLRNGGASAIADCPVKVRLGERQVAAFNISLEAGQAVTTVVQVQLPDKQLALGQVVTGDSPVTFDNDYYFTLQPTAAIKVVEIGAEPVAQQAYGAESLFSYSFVKPQQVNYGKLQQANLVLIREVTGIDAGLQQALVSVVRRGGSVVVVPSGATTGRDATVQLLKALGVGNVEWAATASRPPATQEVAMPSSKNPFFREVFGAQPRQVVLPQVAPILSLGRGATDILRLRDGDSYLAEFRNVGAGRTYVFTAPFDKAYGDFTAQGLFVPVLYRLAMLSYHTSQQPAYRLTEPAVTLETVQSPTVSGQETPAFRLVRDSVTLIPVQRLRGTSLQLELPAGMSQPGFYALQRNGKLVTTLAFNPAQQESELAAYSAAELRQLVGADHPNVQVLEGTPGPEALARYRAEQTGQSLWRYFLLAALLSLLAEGLLLRFGRPKASARQVAVA